VFPVAARKTTARPAKPAPVVPPPCSVCKGTGQVAVKVRVGRRQRVVGDQEGMCLTCFGSGESTT
jgi:DnaJ-class molecular chaperone